MFFYTAGGEKIPLKNLEKFGDIAPTTTQSNVKSLDDSLRLRGNLSLDGTIRASKYLMEDGSDMKLSSSQSGLPSSVSFDAQGNMNMNGVIKASKYLMGDGTELKSGLQGPVGPTGPAGQAGLTGQAGPIGQTGQTGLTGPAGQSGLPSNLSFDAQGNMNMNGNMNTTGTIKASKYLMADGSEMKTGSSTQSGLPSSVAFDAQGNMTVKGNIGLSNTKMHFRGTEDPNHYVGYSTDVDGPVLSGCAGGKLRSHCYNKDVLVWNNDGVSVNGQMSVNGINLGKTSVNQTSENTIDAKGNSSSINENWAGPSIYADKNNNNQPQALFIGSSIGIVKISGNTWVDKLRIGKDIFLSQDPQGNLIVKNEKTSQQQIINLSGAGSAVQSLEILSKTGGPEGMLKNIATSGGPEGRVIPNGSPEAMVNKIIDGGTGGELGRYHAEKRYANGDFSSGSGPLMYGINMIKGPRPNDIFLKNNENGPAIRYPIGGELTEGRPTQLTINNGFKATLYYSAGKDNYGNNTFRPEQLSFPSANKNVWKQFANPNNKEVQAIVVVKDSEPEPGNSLLYMSLPPSGGGPEGMLNRPSGGPEGMLATSRTINSGPDPDRPRVNVINSPGGGVTLDAGINGILDVNVVYFPLDKDTNDNTEIHIINTKGGVGLVGSSNPNESKTVRIRKLDKTAVWGDFGVSLEQKPYRYRYSKPMKMWEELPPIYLK